MFRIRGIGIRHFTDDKMGLGNTCWRLPGVLKGKEAREEAEKFFAAHGHLLTNINYFVTSPVIRAQQSLFEIFRFLGHETPAFDTLIHWHPGLWTDNPLPWYSDDPVAMIWRKNPRFVEKEGKRFLRVLTDISSSACLVNPKMSDGVSTFLFVSHGGPLEAATAEGKTAVGWLETYASIRDFGKGEGVIIDAIYYLGSESERIYPHLKILDVQELRLP